MLRIASSSEDRIKATASFALNIFFELEETFAKALSTYASTAEERLLLREITHRVNNEFASAIQAVSFTAATARDNKVKVALTHVMEKLHNYARVHRVLQMPTSNDCIDASAYLRELCRSISNSKLENRNIELVLVADPLQMPSEQCWLMGMIVSELITIAVRHAFDQRGGTIRVECRTSQRFVECRVSDNRSASSSDVLPGSGLRILEALAQAFGAGFQFDFGKDGSGSVLSVPIEQVFCDEPKLVRGAPNNVRMSHDSFAPATHRPT